MVETNRKKEVTGFSAEKLVTGMFSLYSLSPQLRVRNGLLKANLVDCIRVEKHSGNIYFYSGNNGVQS